MFDVCYRIARRSLAWCYTSFVSLLQINTKMSRWVLHDFRVLVTDQHEDVSLGVTRLSCPCYRSARRCPAGLCASLRCRQKSARNKTVGVFTRCSGACAALTSSPRRFSSTFAAPSLTPGESPNLHSATVPLTDWYTVSTET